MPRTLDKSASFSTFHPPYNGAVFWQNGANFSADGVLLWEDASAPVVEPKTEPVVDPVEPVTADVEGNAPSGDERALLVAWLLGKSEEKVNFFTAKAWGKAVFDETFKTKDELIGHCIEKGLVNAEDVRA